MEEVVVGNEAGFMSTIIIGDQLNALEASMVPQKNDSKPKANKKSKEKKDIVEKTAKQGETQSAFTKKLQGEVSVEAAAKQNETQLKSALKSSVAKPLSRSVTWADEKKIESKDAGNLGNGQTIEEKSESTKSSSVSDVDDYESSLRFASAEACAIALIEAAEAVASGECDGEDAGKLVQLLISHHSL